MKKEQKITEIKKKASKRDRGNVKKGGKKIKCWRKKEKKKNGML